MPQIPVTNRQWLCAYYHVYGASKLTAYAKAFLHGVEPATANKRRMTYGKIKKLFDSNTVIRFMDEIRQELLLYEKMTPEQHMGKLAELRDQSQAMGDMKAAIKAEELRGKCAGFYVEQILVGHTNLDEFEVQERLKRILDQYPQLRDKIHGRMLPIVDVEVAPVEGPPAQLEMIDAQPYDSGETQETQEGQQPRDTRGVSQVGETVPVPALIGKPPVIKPKAIPGNGTQERETEGPQEVID